MLDRVVRLMVFALVILLSACGNPNPLQTKFERLFPKPDWFDTVESVTLNNVTEVNTLWGSVKRCCTSKDILKRNNRIMYKSCYRAILRNLEQRDLVVQCLWFMPGGATAPQRRLLAEFMIEHFGDHNVDTTKCTNCKKADTIARTTLTLARYRKNEKRSQESIRLIEELTDKRGPEISAWVLGEMFEFLSEIYLQQKVSDNVKARYKSISKMLELDVTAGKTQPWRLRNFQKAYQEILAN